VGAGTTGKGTTSVVPNRAPLEQFRARYGDRSITKWDIFHCIYAVLHHPEYRQRYAANLRRELPRIPFVSATPDRVGTGIPARPAEPSSASALKGDGLGRPETFPSTLSSRAKRDFCHPERSVIFRSRKITRSRGTCFLPTPSLTLRPAKRLRKQTAGLSTP
jgi:hypothetical protein